LKLVQFAAQQEADRHTTLGTKALLSRHRLRRRKAWPLHYISVGVDRCGDSVNRSNQQDRVDPLDFGFRELGPTLNRGADS
jgi:hypothetical protein